MNDIQLALYEVKTELDREMEKLHGRMLLIEDDIILVMLAAKIAGLKIAREYITKKMECWND